MTAQPPRPGPRAQVGDLGFRAGARQHVAFGDQQIVSRDHRVACHAVGECYASCGRQFRPGQQPPVENRGAQLRVQLAHETARTARAERKRELEYWFPGNHDFWSG